MLEQTANRLPAKVGVGYKPAALCGGRGRSRFGRLAGWLEVNAENFMDAGGRHLAQLRVWPSGVRSRSIVSVFP